MHTIDTTEVLSMYVAAPKFVLLLKIRLVNKRLIFDRSFITILWGSNKKRVFKTCSFQCTWEIASLTFAKLPTKNRIRQYKHIQMLIMQVLKKHFLLDPQFRSLMRTSLSYWMLVWSFRYDVGNDKFIDFHELKLMMEKLGAPQTHLSLKAMISEVDEDHDNRISFREVCIHKSGFIF